MKAFDLPRVNPDWEDLEPYQLLAWANQLHWFRFESDY